ncbi:Uncharacterised protein [Sphingobacterium thalpophilum]|uniref:Uncharacterized protein n=1 Tax=Sphingobacterium thalpophilum TaxID=259 RepID=A0A4V6KRW8_9SPHI|nr:Uncharacterised protein [Sphingobacterium thalpophilum]
MSHTIQVFSYSQHFTIFYPYLPKFPDHLPKALGQNACGKKANFSVP